MMQKYYPVTMAERSAWKELLRACSENDTELVHTLLEHGVDPNYQDPEYHTSPFFEAIHAGHWRCVQLLISSGASLTAVEELTGMTPLQVALYERQHVIVDVLLDRLPSRHRRGIKTILVCGRMRKEVLQSLAETGHILLVDDDESDPGMVQDLQFATGNRKIQLANMVSTELVTVTDLIIREVEGVNLLEFLADYFPLMVKVERILVVTNKPPPSIALTWLLRNNIKVTGLIAPSWWDALLDFDWLKKWQQTIWWLLSTYDHLQGTAYNYKLQIVATSTDSYVLPEMEDMNIKFKNLVVTNVPGKSTNENLFQNRLRSLQAPRKRCDRLAWYVGQP